MWKLSLHSQSIGLSHFFTSRTCLLYVVNACASTVKNAKLLILQSCILVN